MQPSRQQPQQSQQQSQQQPTQQTQDCHPAIVFDYSKIVWEEELTPFEANHDYYKNPPLLHLYSKCGHASIGYWPDPSTSAGAMGEHYIAWAPVYPEGHLPN